MTYPELLILAISLTFDTFAVSVGGGISLPDVKISKKAQIVAFFGLFQGAYLFAGWFIGGKFANIISEWDHWVAFAILTYLGGKMFLGAFYKQQQEEHLPDFLSWKKLFFFATATSIDAVAVGASLALLEIDTTAISITTLFTVIATAAASWLGLQGGRKLGDRVGKKAEMWGGVVLIVIGMKILIEHAITFG